MQKITEQNSSFEKTEKTLEKTLNLILNLNKFVLNMQELKQLQLTATGNDLLTSQTKIEKLRKLFVEESTRIQLIKYLLKWKKL